MYRQGDLLIEAAEIPEGAKALATRVLAEGEITGHAHVAQGDVTLYEIDGMIYIHVEGKATIKHEEHAAIVLPTGDYRVIRQREYNPYERVAREVAD
jgi:quercetin dioxygenase-like cupin family protein